MQKVCLGITKAVLVRNAVTATIFNTNENTICYGYFTKNYKIVNFDLDGSNFDLYDESKIIQVKMTLKQLYLQTLIEDYPDLRHFNLIITANRLLKRIPIERAAKALGLTRDQYINFENGTRRGSISLSNQEIANRLNFNVDEFTYSLEDCFMKEPQEEAVPLKTFDCEFFPSEERNLACFMRLLYKQPFTAEEICDEYEINRSTFTRMLQTIRIALENTTSLHASIQYNRQRKTYYLVFSDNFTFI